MTLLPDNITLKTADVTDADILAEMEAVCFSEAWSREAFIQTLNNPAFTVIIAKKDNIPLGYICYSTVADEAEIANIAVLPKHRGLGVGKFILSEVLDRCAKNGIKFFYLEHRTSNTAARSLYESVGFTTCGIRKNYYTSPKEDAILMKLEIEN